MKRFIIISLLCLGMGMNKAYGCAGMSTHNYYLFSVTGSTTFQQRVDEISRKNWIAYGDGAIQYGYNRHRPLVMYAAAVLLILLVQIFQSVGNAIAKRSDRRLRS